MKWKNKGHEFDEMGKSFIENPDLYIYGAGDYGTKVYKLLHWLGVEISFIDGNRKKQIEGFLGQKVYSPIELRDTLKGKNIVIAAGTKIAQEMEKILLEYGYKRNVDFWDYSFFCQEILPVYMIYVKKKCYMNSVGFLSTTVCNLNCDGCLNFTAYNKNMKHEDLEMLKKTLDEYFKVVDYVNLFSYTGGEPLLYPNLDEMIEYIGSNYRDKIHTFLMSTNCTIVPMDSTCELFKKYNFKVCIDNYSEYVEKAKTILPLIEGKLQKYEIEYYVASGDVAYWIDLAPDKTDNSSLTDEQLIEYHTKCACPYHEIRDGKIYACNYASFAMKAGLVEENRNDWLSLKEIIDKKILCEFALGYTEKGYVDFCKKCAGFLPINPYKKPVGKQVRGDVEKRCINH